MRHAAHSADSCDSHRGTSIGCGHPHGSDWYEEADSLCRMHVVADYAGEIGHNAQVEEYVAPPQPTPTPQPAPHPQPRNADTCAPEKTARDGAAVQLSVAWLSVGLACAPISPSVFATCPLAIGAVTGAWLQLKGNQGQYERCLRDNGLHAEADAQSEALAALEAEVGQLQAFGDQLTAASATG